MLQNLASRVLAPRLSSGLPPLAALRPRFFADAFDADTLSGPKNPRFNLRGVLPAKELATKSEAELRELALQQISRFQPQTRDEHLLAHIQRELFDKPIKQCTKEDIRKAFQNYNIPINPHNLIFACRVFGQIGDHERGQLVIDLIFELLESDPEIFHIEYPKFLTLKEVARLWNDEEMTPQDVAKRAREEWGRRWEEYKNTKDYQKYKQYYSHNTGDREKIKFALSQQEFDRQFSPSGSQQQQQQASSD